MVLLSIGETFLQLIFDIFGGFVNLAEFSDFLHNLSDFLIPFKPISINFSLTILSTFIGFSLQNNLVW